MDFGFYLVVWIGLAMALLGAMVIKERGNKSNKHLLFLGALTVCLSCVTVIDVVGRMN